jgi:hypothetical protein
MNRFDKRRFGVAIVLGLVVLGAGIVVGQQRRVAAQPKTIIHFVWVKWTPNSTEAEQQRVIDGVKTMAAKVPGIKNVWVKTIRAQTPFNAAFAIEFVNQEAADDYRDHPAHKAWDSELQKIRETSLSGQATN